MLQEILKALVNEIPILKIKIIIILATDRPKLTLSNACKTNFKLPPSYSQSSILELLVWKVYFL